MLGLLPRVAAASLVGVGVLTASPTAAQTFPASARPTRSGYINVTSTNSLYFAFYEAAAPPTARALPLFVRLQGGPGCSSLIGNFAELCPYLLLNSTAGLTHKASCSSTTRSVPGSAHHLARGRGNTELRSRQSMCRRAPPRALQSFMAVDPGFRARPLFLTDESYGGKYIPAAAAHILDANAGLLAEQRVTLQGMAIGNGMTPGSAGDRARRPGLLSQSDQREAEGRGRGNAEHHGAPRASER
jgi:vitellogenic carboxypeptidase-like protein